MSTVTIAKSRPDKALSATFVRNVTEPGWYPDGNCLYLVVDENGSKRWQMRLTILEADESTTERSLGFALSRSKLPDDLHPAINQGRHGLPCGDVLADDIAHS
jgi:hypothetical protein